MVDVTKEYRVGLLRSKYLDLANMDFAQGDYDGVKEQIKNFMDTIDDNSKAAQMLRKEFDEAYLKRKKDRLHFDNELQTQGFLEQSVNSNRGFDEIDLNTLHDLKTICWTIANKQGLLYE